MKIKAIGVQVVFDKPVFPTFQEHENGNVLVRSFHFLFFCFSWIVEKW